MSPTPRPDRLPPGEKSLRELHNEIHSVTFEIDSKENRSVVARAYDLGFDECAKAAAYDRINTPEIDDFLSAVKNEALHQRERWGVDQDGGKEPADWFWLVGYLAGKALHDVKGKRLHHIITTGAALLNWHAHAIGAYARMRASASSRPRRRSRRRACRSSTECSQRNQDSRTEPAPATERPMSAQKKRKAKKLWHYTAGEHGAKVTVEEKVPGGVLYERIWDPTAGKDGTGAQVRRSLGHRDQEAAKRTRTRPPRSSRWACGRRPPCRRWATCCAST
jgi:hypothetical protein